MATFSPCEIIPNVSENNSFILPISVEETGKFSFK